MSPVSADQLDNCAREAIAGVDRLLLDEDVIRGIVVPYTEFCRGGDARRLGVTEKPVTEDMVLRLRFECLCFCAFCAFLQAPHFLRRGHWFPRPDRRLVKSFDGALGIALVEHCDCSGMSAMREIVLTALDPEPRFGLGGAIDPIGRLEEYRGAFVAARGTELEHFGKWIGKTLNAPNYPLFEAVGVALGPALVRLSQAALTHAFAPKT